MAYTAGRYATSGDPTWEVRWLLVDENNDGLLQRTNGVALRCRANPPVEIAALTSLQAVTRLPTGEHRLVDQRSMTGSAYEIAFPPLGSMLGDWPKGEYEVRWYASSARRKQYEVSRRKFALG